MPPPFGAHAERELRADQGRQRVVQNSCGAAAGCVWEGETGLRTLLEGSASTRASVWDSSQDVPGSCPHTPRAPSSERRDCPETFPKVPIPGPSLHPLWKKARTGDSHSRLHKVRTSETSGSGRGRVLHGESSVHPLWGCWKLTGMCILYGLLSSASGYRMWSHSQLVNQGQPQAGRVQRKRKADQAMGTAGLSA